MGLTDFPAGLEQVVDGIDPVNVIKLRDGIQGFDAAGILIELTMDIFIIFELTHTCLYILQKVGRGLIDTKSVVREFWYECHRGRGAVGF